MVVLGFLSEISPQVTNYLLQVLSLSVTIWVEVTSLCWGAACACDESVDWDTTVHCCCALPLAAQSLARTRLWRSGLLVATTRAQAYFNLTTHVKSPLSCTCLFSSENLTSYFRVFHSIPLLQTLQLARPYYLARSVGRKQVWPSYYDSKNLLMVRWTRSLIVRLSLISAVCTSE